MRSQLDTVSSVNKPGWDTYVFTHPQATHYHLSGWGEIIERVYGYSALYFSEWQEDRLTGVLPVVILGGLLRRKSFVSLPYLDYGGICADTPAAGHALYMAAHRELTTRGAGLLDLRQRFPTLLSLQHYGDKVTMVLRLASAAEQMWKAFGAKLRNQIRKAEKAQLQTQWVGAERVGDFYRVYLHNMRDLGSPTVSEISQHIKVKDEEMLNGAVSFAAQKGWLMVGGQPVHSVLLTLPGLVAALKKK